MSEILNIEQDVPEVPRLIIDDSVEDEATEEEDDEFSKEDAALRQEIDRNVAELEQLAEESIRAKNVADAEAEIGNYEERRKNGTLPEGVRDEQDFEEYAEEKRARAREAASAIVREARQKVIDAYGEDDKD